VRERLAAHLGEVFWSDLRAHAARDALILVGGDLDLIEVGVAVATDDAARVTGWIQAGLVSKPSAGELAAMAAEPGDVFVSLIVAPFVLVKPKRPLTPPPAS
jgi:hypothetical protein